MPERYLANFYIALEAVMGNKLRSALTALGIIFGVAAVIAMLAVGNGAQQELLEQIKLVGVNNIVITPVIEQKEEKVEENVLASSQQQRKFSPGLTLADVEAIKAVVPGLSLVSPEIEIETSLVSGGISRSIKLVGVEPAYFQIYDFKLSQGRGFNEQQLLMGEQVCIIGKSIAARFFTKEDPIGKYIKCGRHWLKVVGVLEERYVSEGSVSKLGIRDFNMDVYVPVKTLLLRYQNRALVTQAMIRKADSDKEDMPPGTQPSFKNYHQLDKLVIQVKDTDYLTPTAETISRMFKRRHYGMVDFEITIPELLLKQQQRTKDIFNIVLGAIAGISLLVGGIGIMNIMLASVLERIKEIGLRISLGAKKTDIVFQFMVEAVLISFMGGTIGVILGVSLASVISAVADIPTIISPVSIILSFGVATTVGLIFGIMPARKAASQDPITCLRYE
jgi:putative ABC transport system permease protein